MIAPRPSCWIGFQSTRGAQFGGVFGREHTDLPVWHIHQYPFDVEPGEHSPSSAGCCPVITARRRWIPSTPNGTNGTFPSSHCDCLSGGSRPIDALPSSCCSFSCTDGFSSRGSPFRGRTPFSPSARVDQQNFAGHCSSHCRFNRQQSTVGAVIPLFLHS